MKIKFLLFIVLTSLVSYSQNFPGANVDLLLTKEIRVKEVSESLQKYGYENFFEDQDLKTVYNCCDRHNSKYSGLVGKIFKVLSAEKYTNTIGKEKYKLKIENSETGVIYFNYSPEFEHAFPFEVIGGLDLPEDFYCSKIESLKSESGTIRYYTPYAGGIVFWKVIENGVTNFYLGVNERGSTAEVNKTGLTLSLENGEKLSRPDAEIDIKVNTAGKGFIYKAFVPLTKEDIELLLKHNITGDRLYIYEGTVNKEDAELLRKYLKCLTK